MLQPLREGVWDEVRDPVWLRVRVLQPLDEGVNEPLAEALQLGCRTKPVAALEEGQLHGTGAERPFTGQ